MGRRDRLVEAGIVLAPPLSLPALLRQIVDIAVDISEARYGALGVLGADGGLAQFITHGITEEEREAIGNLPVGRGVLGAMMRETKLLRISDISAHPNSVGFPKNHPQMTTFLGAPIVAHGNVFGDLYLADKAGSKEFTTEDEEAVSVLAAQAGVAIENAHLYEEIRRHEAWLDAGSAITMAMLGGAGSDETLRLIAQRARGLVAADLATIALPDVTGARLVLKVVDGVHAEELYGATFPVEGSISGRVIRESRAAVFENVSADESSSQPDVRLGDIGPAIVVPLVGKGGAFGTLLAANLRGGRTFGPADVLPLEAFADQAALAFEYSRLQEEGRRIARDLHDGVAQELAFVAR
jgi:GAF domain-containing protein